MTEQEFPTVEKVQKQLDEWFRQLFQNQSFGTIKVLPPPPTENEGEAYEQEQRRLDQEAAYRTFLGLPDERDCYEAKVVFAKYMPMVTTELIGPSGSRGNETEGEDLGGLDPSKPQVYPISSSSDDIPMITLQMSCDKVPFVYGDQDDQKPSE